MKVDYIFTIYQFLISNNITKLETNPTRKCNKLVNDNFVRIKTKYKTL